MFSLRAQNSYARISQDSRYLLGRNMVIPLPVAITNVLNIKTINMRCPYCKNEESRVIDTSHDVRGGVRRRRECESCGQRFSTYERPILATPLIVKQDGTREEFDRDKLLRGIRISCAKRPVSAADIERLVGEIEATLQAMGRAEVSSRVVGDMVIAGLKELDHIAYIRYAIVYLGLDDLRSIRTEIDRLLEG
jgi:transcriptional repressor NrdR